MKTRTGILTLAVLGVFGIACSPTMAQSDKESPEAQSQPGRDRGPGPEIDAGDFYNDLAPYGDWVEMPDYGWSFAPRVDQDWRPYTRGQWVSTDDGWFWDSDEEFGWAAYHYGRWVDDNYYGWVWIPGNEWAPAWVSWRYGNGYTGWAPLPPRAAWQTHVGLRLGGLDIDGFIGSRDYNFVEDRWFVDRGIYRRVLAPSRNIGIIKVTNNVTNYAIVNNRVVNRSIAVENVERAIGGRVPRARTVDRDRAGSPSGRAEGEVSVYRPQVRTAADRRPANGRSLVKGEAPPAALVERKKEREQERQRAGNAPETTAKEAEQRRPQGSPSRDRGLPAQPRPQPQVSVPPQPAPAQPRGDRERSQPTDPRARNQQPADQQRAQQDRDAKAQADQRRQGAQGNDHARVAPSPRPTTEPKAPSPEVRQHQAQPQPRDTPQDASGQRARDQERLRAERERRQAADQQKQNPQPVDQPRTKPKGEPPPEAKKPAKDAPPENRGRGNDKKNPKPTPTPPDIQP